jgi:rod shape-determining protein MreB
MLQRLFASLGTDLALDLGTASTLIGVPGEGLVLHEPSVVAVEQGTNQILSGGCAIGFLAKQMLGRTPGSVSVVRPLSEGVITDFDLCEAMLRYFLRKTQRSSWGMKPRILATAPGRITPVEKRALYNSAHRAGARQVYLISTAKAAAIGLGLPITEPVASMICDLGCGTTEVAVLSLAEVVASHSSRTGGDRMDEALVTYFRQRHNLRVGIPTAEQLRINIGSAAPLAEELTDVIRGVDLNSGLPRSELITSTELRQALDQPLAEIVHAIKLTLDQCGPDLVADLVDQGMILCGGGAQLRGIERYLTERTGIPARLAHDPVAAVVEGACVCLEHFDRWAPTLESSDDDV